jgi:hypothetical protein
VSLHCFENLVHLGEEITTAQPAIIEAPLVTVYLCDINVSRLQGFQYLRGQPMYKFGAKLDWNLRKRIALGEHPPANAVASFEHSDREPSPGQAGGSR